MGSKKVGLRPDAGDGVKRTNEIGAVIPLLETLPDVAGHTITADALLTQRRLADYLLGRGADYLFTVKGNQPKLHDRIGLIKARGLAVAETMRNLARNPRRVLDFLKMTANACPQAAPG